MTYEYPALAKVAIDRLVTTQQDRIDTAADKLAEAVRAGGVIQAFGTGHSRIPMHEMAGRAGGLVPVNLVRLQDLAFFGNREPATLLDPMLERDVELGAELFAVTDAQPGDPFLIASNSGINGAVVEFALRARAADHLVIAICSAAHSASVASRHPDGAKLGDLADLVIDTQVAPGDASLELPDGTRVGALSNLIGVVIVQMLTEGIARRLIQAGEAPPVYLSMNQPGGDETNSETFARYENRVRPIEP